MTGEIVKEHKHGLSVATPKCDVCGKYPDQMGHRAFPYATGGFYFQELFFYCSKCKNKMIVPQPQIELLNKYSSVSRKSFYAIVWQTPPQFAIDRTGTGSTFYPT